MEFRQELAGELIRNPFVFVLLRNSSASLFIYLLVPIIFQCCFLWETVSLCASVMLCYPFFLEVLDHVSLFKLRFGEASEEVITPHQFYENTGKKIYMKISWWSYQLSLSLWAHRIHTVVRSLTGPSRGNGSLEIKVI